MRKLWPIAALGFFFTTAASAHHSFAMFDMTKIQEVSGTVKDVQWANPHTWVDIVVVEKDGHQVQWGLECASPNVLARRGWKRDTLKPGDKVTFSIFPLRDGSPGGALRQAILADGTIFGGYDYPRVQ